MAPTTTRPRKTTAGRNGNSVLPKAPKLEPLDADEIVPVRIVHQEETEAPDRVVLFYIDDVPYDVPKTIPKSAALKVLRVMRTQGQEAAMQLTMELMLGEDAYEALMECDDVTDEQLETIVTTCSRLMFGKAENAAGKG